MGEGQMFSYDSFVSHMVESKNRRLKKKKKKRPPEHAFNSGKEFCHLGAPSIWEPQGQPKVDKAGVWV